MVVQKKQTKPKLSKGQVKPRPDADNPDKNPLLYIDENKNDFVIATSNLLQDPSGLIFKGFETFDLKKETDHFDLNRLKNNSTIVVVLRYYEYICTATAAFEYIIPMLESGLTAKDVFDMMKHCLKNKLLMNVPSFDVIFEPDIHYTGKIWY